MSGAARARMQEQPGNYFTVVQMGLNAVAILAGIVGEGTLRPHYSTLFGWCSSLTTHRRRASWPRS